MFTGSKLLTYIFIDIIVFKGENFCGQDEHLVTVAFKKLQLLETWESKS